MTPLLSREQAEQFGQIAGAEVGMSRLSGGRKFADEFFDPKKALYEPEELTDLLGTRFLARKIKDVPPHVPALDEVRPEVSLAWKIGQGSPPRREGRQELAEKLKKKADALKDGPIEGFRVVTIPAITRLQTNFLASQFESGTPEETPIPDVPYAGESFRKAYFDLQPGSVAVAPNQPGTDLLRHGARASRAGHLRRALCPQRRRIPLQDVRPRPGGPAARRQWMGWLRKQAGLDQRLGPARRGQGQGRPPTTMSVIDAGRPRDVRDVHAHLTFPRRSGRSRRSARSTRERRRPGESRRAWPSMRLPSPRTEKSQSQRDRERNQAE